MRRTCFLLNITTVYARFTALFLTSALFVVVTMGLPACGTVPAPASTAQSVVIDNAGEVGEHRRGVFAGKGEVELFEQSWKGVDPKAVLVIVHGLKDHSDRYAWTVPTLVKHKYAVYAFDLRGHAHSKGERVYVESFADYVADLDRYIARVHQAEPGKPLFLLGHSMGAAIATRYVQTHPENVQGLALSAGALKVGEPAIMIGASRLIATLIPRAPLFQLDLDDFSRDPQVVSEGKADPLVEQGGAPVHTAVQIIDAIDALQDQAASVTLPVLFMHGTADVVTPPEGSQEIYAHIPSQHKSLKLYEGLAHDLLHEPEKEQVLTDIVHWMDATLQYVGTTPLSKAVLTPASSADKI